VAAISKASGEVDARDSPCGARRGPCGFTAVDQNVDKLLANIEALYEVLGHWSTASLTRAISKSQWVFNTIQLRNPRCKGQERVV
jgi:hypothetical protein